jgi:hypothetical protein
VQAAHHTGADNGDSLEASRSHGFSPLPKQERKKAALA